jgi:hypothetical protein
MADPVSLYLRNFQASVNDGSYFKKPSYEEFEGDSIPYDMTVPMQPVSDMPMRESQPVEVRGGPVIDGDQLGAGVGVNAPVGRGNLDLNATLVPGDSRLNANYNQPLGRGNLGLNASMGRGGVQNVGANVGQPVGDGYVNARANYQPQSKNFDVGVDYQNKDTGIGLSYNRANKALMANATKRF